MAAGTMSVLDQFELQARACDDMGSPFTARLCRILIRRLDRSTRFGARILDWPGDAHDDNVALRACGALHSLARSDWEPGLKLAYPPHEASDHTLWVAIVDALQHQDSYLASHLD